MWYPDVLSRNDVKYAENFERIARDLSVEIEKPFSIVFQGKTYLYAFMVKNFGIKSASRGLVARVGGDPFVPEQCDQIWTAAFENGYIPWNQAPGAINCERQEIIEWLNCCLWFGPAEERPAWHTAENYEEVWNEGPSA